MSVLGDESLDQFRQAVWDLTGLIRVFLHHDGTVDPEPIALHPPATVADAAAAIHGELGERCRGAKIWGPTARFAGQHVGPSHFLGDGDTVEVLT